MLSCHDLRQATERLKGWVLKGEWSSNSDGNLLALDVPEAL